MDDLSNLADNSIWATSQAAGNRQSDPRYALTAPGSKPVDPVLAAEHQSDPTVELIATDARQLDRGDGGSNPRPAWTGSSAKS